MSKTPSIMKTVTPNSSFLNADNISENTIPPQKIGIRKIILYVFLLFSVLILLYNSYLHFYKKTDILEKHFGINISQYFQNTKVGALKFLQGTKDTVDISKKNIDLSRGSKIHNINKKSPIEKKMDLKNKYAKDLEKIDSDSSYNSSLKKNKKNGGFCYIGTDKRHRHCVKMQAGDVCASNKIFPTRDICINPNLKG